MCAPGGKIIVYTGLLDKFSTDAEIAAVLGHEVAHAIARHTAEGLTKNMWILMLTVFLGIFIDEPKMIDKLAKYLLSLPFSRKMEIEADHIGILLLAAAGFDPRIAPKVHEKLGELGGNSSSLKEYMSTHPCSKKRTRLLLDSKVMDKAMALYTEARARKEEIDR
ncbi:mitochondrial metalloendopeptidase OMA1 isoform X1 [Triticum aestivum]|nr:mitochondrial metalloendopeptidase OMA1-like isoform X1 [Triticum aestivum]